jgi:phospholipase A2
MSNRILIGVTSVVIASGLLYILYENDQLQPLPPTRLRSDIRAQRQKERVVEERKEAVAEENAKELAVLPFGKDVVVPKDETAWTNFASGFAIFSGVTDVKLGSVADTLADFIMPEWAKSLPGYINKLQRELSMARGSLADEIWQEAHDPFINPEIEHSASVRVSTDLCDEEK